MRRTKAILYYTERGLSSRSLSSRRATAEANADERNTRERERERLTVVVCVWLRRRRRRLFLGKWKLPPSFYTTLLL